MGSGRRGHRRIGARPTQRGGHGRPGDGGQHPPHPRVVDVPEQGDGWVAGAGGAQGRGGQPAEALARVGHLLHGAEQGFLLDVLPAFERGLQQRIEGPSIKGRRVLVVEDTTTTGASPLEAVAACREEGAEVVGVATIADRATGAQEKIEAEGLTYVSAFSMEDLGLA